MGLDTIHFPPLPIVKVHLIINCVLAFLTLVVVGLRLAARFISGAKLGWDDYLILLAFPQAIGMLIIQGLWTTMGIGYSTTETMPNLTTILKLLVAYELIFSTTISTIKLSVMFFYLRVFVNRSLRLATKCVMAFVLAWSAGNILQVFLICRPFEATYNPLVKGECGSQVASFIAIGSFNVITDCLILTLPIPTVWSLKMRTPAKIGLTGVFLIGLTVSVVAIIRIVTLTKLDLTHLTETMIWADFWSTVEPMLGILCVSLPMLGSLYSRCTARRGASKIEGPSSASDYYHQSNKYNLSRRRNRSDLETFGLDTIYAPNMDVQHDAEVSTGKEQHVSTSRDGSEASLTNESNTKDGAAITVHKKWAISHG